MAYPTRITITSGRIVEGGDPVDDGGVTGRRVQVSVTYRLERDDTDLLHLTALKAREVEQAQAAVWRQVNGEQTELWRDERVDGADASTASPPCPPDEDDLLWGGPEEPNEDQGEDPEEDPDWPGDGPPYGGEDEGPGEEGQAEADEGSHGDGGVGPPSRHPVPAQGQHSCHTGTGIVPGIVPGNGHIGPSHDGPSPGDPGHSPLSVRKPQKLAIEAQARRLGLSDAALADIIRERYGKSSFTPRFAVDRLTKAEAADLLRTLSAREWETARASQPAPD